MKMLDLGDPIVKLLWLMLPQSPMALKMLALCSTALLEPLPEPLLELLLELLMSCCSNTVFFVELSN